MFFFYIKISFRVLITFHDHEKNFSIAINFRITWYLIDHRII